MPSPPASPAQLIDIGLNLAHDSFDRDREAVLERARLAGVTRMIVTGSSLASTPAAIELARRYPQMLRATAGVHPHHAIEVDEAVLPTLKDLAQQTKVVAVGECGLDYFRDLSPRPAQRSAFERQLEIGAQVEKPLFLHQRDAHEDFVAILQGHERARAHGGVAHCFTDDTDKMRAYLDLGLHIGITGWICDERRGAHLKEAVRYIPADRLLVETDAPYLLPRDLPQKTVNRRNEPEFLPHIVRAIAAARGEDWEELARTTTANAERLFRLSKLAG
jgi:TatD DNase family protein